MLDTNNEDQQDQEFLQIPNSSLDSLESNTEYQIVETKKGIDFSFANNLLNQIDDLIIEED